MGEIAGRIPARAALAVALVFAWLNFLLTTKWALLPGALNGWKRPWYAVALLAVTWFTLRPLRHDGPVRLRAVPLLAAGGSALLIAAFLASFPPSTWQLLPFNDDWVPRYQSTIDGVRLLERGAVVGWQWAFLGGYQTSADLTQSLTVLGAIPIWLAGDRLGFHLLHLILVVGIPLFVYVDLSLEGRRDVARLSAFFALMCTVGMFGTIMPSGDTNSIAGVFTAALAILGSALARAGRRWGGGVLVLGLTLTLYSHGAFFLYVGIFLALESLFYRDLRMLVRATGAGLVAVLAALPQYIEMLRYPEYFLRNNLLYAKAPVDWAHVARQVFYNVEILLHPHRWFNDYLGMTAVFLALFVWMAVQPGRSRARFYAWMVVATMAMFRLNVVEAGFLFARAMHMLVPLAPVPLAWFVLDHTRDRRLAWALVAVFALYPQTKLEAIPHVESVRAFDPGLVDRLAGLDGHLILVENSPHRDLDQDPIGRTERTPFEVHFEAFLPDETGKLLYGQQWDTWHWTPFRGQVVAAGAFRGQAIEKTPHAAFVDELRKWGIRHLVVWSPPTRRYLDARPSVFVRRWEHGLWVQYELAEADTLAVVMTSGTGALAALDALGGEIRLRGAREGERVVVRMNYFPAWRARVGDRDVALFADRHANGGQLAFVAPAAGDYTVQLEYPRRRWLIAFSLAALLAGGILLSPRRRSGASGPPRATASGGPGDEVPRSRMKYSIVTFGCRVNQADSLRLEEELRARGGIDAAPADADLVIVNTCSVTASADQGARQTIRRIARENPSARIVATGCYATRRPDEVSSLPGVIRLVPNEDKLHTVDLLSQEGKLTTGERFGDGDGPCGAPIEPGVAGRTAFTLRVQTGCDERCSYCIIPTTRGRGRSVPIEAVTADVRRIAHAGFKEVGLTGVHLGSYGRDLRPLRSLVDLLRALAALPLDLTFRISSLEPMDCTPEIVDLVAESAGRFAPHLHLPLQHASDRMLARMQRPYTLDDYRRLVDRIVERLPQASIGSDVIVGFPGESDEDFADTVGYLPSSPLSHLHVFPYSDRPGTAASRMGPKIDGRVVRERGARIRGIGADLSRRFYGRQVGTVRPGLTLDDGTLVVTDNFLKLRILPGFSRNQHVRVVVPSRGAPALVI